MKTRKWTIGVAAVTLAMGCFAIGRHAGAQAPDQGGGPGGAGGAGGGGARRGGFGGFGGGSMAVSGDNVFILRGNTLYRLDSATLSVKAHADLPAPAMPAGFGGAFRGGNPAPPPPADAGAPPAQN